MEHSGFEGADKDLLYIERNKPENTKELNGWVTNTHEQYHAGPGIGSTQVKSFLEYPALFYHRHILGNAREDTDALRLGRLVHTAILEPSRFMESYFVVPTFMGLTKEGKPSEQSGEAREKKKAWFRALPPGSLVVTQEERDNLAGMVDSIASHPIASELLKDGVPERSGYFRCPRTGLLLKFRPDFYRQGETTIDIKSCRSAKFRDFQRSAYELGYPTSAGMYLDGASMIDGKKRDDFIFIAVEKEAPWLVEVYVADQELIEFGQKKYREGIVEISKCLKVHEAAIARGEPARAAWPKTTNPSRRIEAMNLTLPAYSMYDE